MSSEVTKLVNDLGSVSKIVGSLGLSISAAQKAFNLDYIENVERIVSIAKTVLGQDLSENDAEAQARTEAFRDILQNLIVALAPARYQYTETSLSVRMDLAQSLDAGVNAGLGLDVGAVSVSAGLAASFGYDYRAAAEVKTVIHAIPANESTFRSLLERAVELSDKSKQDLSKAKEVDRAIADGAERVFKQIAAPKAG